MRSNYFIATATVAAVLMSAGGAANAKGCVAGAAVGGAAGHVAGHHAVLGAVGGCIAGRHMANKKAKEAAAAQKQGTTGASPPAARPAGNDKNI